MWAEWSTRLFLKGSAVRAQWSTRLFRSFLGAVSIGVVWSLCPWVALASCPGGTPPGGISITPSSERFTALNESKSFRIQNTGPSTWTLSTFSLPNGFALSDPSRCLVQGKVYSANQICTVSFSPFTYLAEDDFQVLTSDGLLATAHLDGPDSAPPPPPPPPVNPVLFVHGYTGSSATWSTMLPKFVRERAGWERAGFLTTMDYRREESNITVARSIGTIIDRIITTTGVSKVDIISHSMGGLSSRYYLKNLGGTAKVDEWVSLAGVNHGTRINAVEGLFCTDDIPCTEMDNDPRESDFLVALNAGDETPGSVRYGTWRWDCDPVVNPDESTELLETDAANVRFTTPFTGCGTSTVHEDMPNDTRIYGLVRNFIRT
jgi:triacylglycerol lipase